MRRKASKPKAAGIVLIGASTGGPPVIKEILNNLTRDFSLPILIIQHMPSRFTRPLAEGLDASAAVQVKEAGDKEILQAGVAYVAPGGYQLSLELDTGMRARTRLVDEKLGFSFTPSIDLAAISAASVLGSGVILVLLSGMSAGEDGLQGARVVKEVGGRLLVQEPVTCIVPGIPKSVIREGLADQILRPEEIPPAICKYVNLHYARSRN